MVFSAPGVRETANVPNKPSHPVFVRGFVREARVEDSRALSLAGGEMLSSIGPRTRPALEWVEVLRMYVLYIHTYTGTWYRVCMYLVSCQSLSILPSIPSSWQRAGAKLSGKRRPSSIMPWPQAHRTLAFRRGLGVFVHQLLRNRKLCPSRGSVAEAGHSAQPANKSRIRLSLHM